MNLQPLFPEPIIEQTLFPTAYADHTNDIWRVRTATEDVVVRSPRRAGEWDHAASAFWWGCRQLFGLDPTRPERLLTVNDILARRSPLPVPRALRAGLVEGRPCIIVECLLGERVDDLRALPPAALRTLGGTIATLHQERRDWYGTLDSTMHRPLADFHADLAATLRELVARFHQADRSLAAPLERFCAAALALPAPTYATPIMLDVDATQFLAADGRLTGLVDTDPYACGPPSTSSATNTNSTHPHPQPSRTATAPSPRSPISPPSARSTATSCASSAHRAQCRSTSGWRGQRTFE